MPIIKELYRYPVKGLSPEALQIVQVTKGKAMPMDRCIALAHPETEFDPVNPKHQKKTAYLMLMRNEKLAALKSVFDGNSSVLQIYQNNQEIVSADLDDPEEIKDIETFFEHYLKGEVSGKPKVVFADSSDHTFSDVDAKVLSCINLESVKALEAATGQTIDPLRFRANIYFMVYLHGKKWIG